MAIHVSATTGCNLGCTYCHTAGSLVLTETLEWVPVETLSEGDGVISFDEHTPEEGRYRKYRHGVVTDVHTHEAEVVEVTTGAGTTEVEHNHPFFAKRNQKTRFIEASELRDGDEVFRFTEPVQAPVNDQYKRGYIHGALAGDGSVPGMKDRSEDTAAAYISSIDEVVGQTVSEYDSSLPDSYGFTLRERQYNEQNDTAPMAVSDHSEREQLAQDWSDAADVPQDDDYARGWLAGMFDTDGSSPEGRVIVFQQYPGEIQNRVCEFLDQLGFNYTIDAGVEGEYSDAVRLQPGRGTKRLFEFLQLIRPKVQRKALSFVDNKRIGGTTEVESVESVEDQTVYDVTTTEGTLIVDGYLVHQCYENPDRKRKQEWVDRQYDMDSILEQLEFWKEKYPNTMPGMHGGEPLLVRTEDLRTIYEWIADNYDIESNKPHIQTNGTLIEDEHIELFKEFNVHVGISCDGPAELNDERKAAGERDETGGGGRATAKMTQETHEAIDTLIEEGVGVGIITVLSETNAGSEEDFERLLEWLDYLTKNGAGGHFNPAIPYEEIAEDEDIALSPETLKDRYLRAWEWMKEEQYRTWGPMRDYVDNLLGNQLSNCVNNKCFDPETEILTEDGWRSFAEVTTDEQVATINQDTGELEFQEPYAKQEYHHDGEMLHFESDAYDLMVTPDHDLYVESSKHQGFEKERADRTAERSQRARFKRAPDGWSGNESETFELEAASSKAPNGSLLTVETVSMQTWAEFLGWYVAEGSAGIYGENEEHRVTISQRDDENRARIIEVLEELGFNPRCHDGERVVVSSKQLYNHVADLGQAHTKHVPDYIKDASPAVIETFVDALYAGDGNDQDCLYTVSGQLADEVQELLAKMGTSADIRMDNRGGPDGNWRARHIVSRKDSRSTPHLSGTVERVDYDGMVYDLSVPNGTLYVRRNGKPVTSGNCDVFNAGAAKIVKGDGETTGCGKTWSKVGDGVPFLQGDSTDNEYDDDEERYDMLKNMPGAVTEDAPDMGGCKGCDYWNVCYDEDTEVLTADGWKYFEDVTLDDEIATLDQDTHEVEYHTPLAKQTPEFDGELIHWSGDTYDLRVTPDHNVFARSSPGQPFENHRASEIADNTAISFKRGGEWDGTQLSTFTPKPAVLTDGAIPQTPTPDNRSFDAEDWFRFMGWYLAEGSSQRKDGGDYRITICQRSEEYRAEIRSLLSRMGFSVYMGDKNIQFDSKQVVNHVERFGHAHEKFVPPYIKNASSDLIQSFLTAYAKGDGSLRGDGTPEIIYTASEQMADDLQELGMKADWPSVKGVDDRVEKGSINGHDVDASGPVHYVTFAPGKSEVEVWTESQREQYSGTVYDLTVPNHTMYVRRNGRAMWSGNCQGGGPCAGENHDYRNRTRWCKAKYALYEQVEHDLRAVLPNINLITDLPWDAELAEHAQRWNLDIKPFAAIRPDVDGKSAAMGGYVQEFGTPSERVPDDVLPDETWDQRKAEMEDTFDDEDLVIDEQNHYIHADSSPSTSGWEEVDEDGGDEE